MTEPLVLEPDAEVAGRPFTALARTADDLAALAAIRAAQRLHVPETPGEQHWVDADGAEHWLVVPDPSRLRDGSPAVAIGFFGQARDEVDHEPIVALEHDILRRASRFPALLAYHNVRFASGQWGNLVCFADATGPGHLRGDDAHADAMARTPGHYRSLRLHRLVLPEGPLGEADLRLERTSYYDFTVEPVWRAARRVSRA